MAQVTVCVHVLATFSGTRHTRHPHRQKYSRPGRWPTGKCCGRSPTRPRSRGYNAAIRSWTARILHSRHWPRHEGFPDGKAGGYFHCERAVGNDQLGCSSTRRFLRTAISMGCRIPARFSASMPRQEKHPGPIRDTLAISARSWMRARSDRTDIGWNMTVFQPNEKAFTQVAAIKVAETLSYAHRFSQANESLCVNPRFC